MFHSDTAVLIRAFVADQRGATAVEYGLIVSAVGLTIISAVFTAGEGLKATFQKAIDFFSTFNG